MKIVISKGKKKREITTPFNIAIGITDLEELIACLKKELYNAENCDKDFTYGWIRIAPFEHEASLSGPPEPWEE